MQIVPQNLDWSFTYQQMPVQTIHSCLFEEFRKKTFNILAHQANIHCKMGSGIAAVIRKDFYEAVMADDNTVKDSYTKMGTYSSTQRNGNPDQMIVNLYAQDFAWKSEKNTKYDGLYDSLYLLRNDIISKKLKLKTHAKNPSIGLPYRIGSGLGGGDWNIVRSIIESLFESSEISVTICRNLTFDPL